jgi:hypothetical protein
VRVLRGSNFLLDYLCALLCALGHSFCGSHSLRDLCVFVGSLLVTRSCVFRWIVLALLCPFHVYWIRCRNLTGFYWVVEFLHCGELVGVLCRDCTTNHTMLDDIVSELWRKENVTSGYCPRYRYTLIATLTLDNLYYICVDFLPTMPMTCITAVPPLVTHLSSLVASSPTIARPSVGRKYTHIYTTKYLE